LTARLTAARHCDRPTGLSRCRWSLRSSHQSRAVEGGESGAPGGFQAAVVGEAAVELEDEHGLLEADGMRAASRAALLGRCLYSDGARMPSRSARRRTASACLEGGLGVAVQRGHATASHSYLIDDEKVPESPLMAATIVDASSRPPSPARCSHRAAPPPPHRDRHRRRARRPGPGDASPVVGKSTAEIIGYRPGTPLQTAPISF
jgi:hypothetical protein